MKRLIFTSIFVLFFVSFYSFNKKEEADLLGNRPIVSEVNVTSKTNNNLKEESYDLKKNEISPSYIDNSVLYSRTINLGEQTFEGLEGGTIKKDFDFVDSVPAGFESLSHIDQIDFVLGGKKIFSGFIKHSSKGITYHIYIDDVEKEVFLNLEYTCDKSPEIIGFLSDCSKLSSFNEKFVFIEPVDSNNTKYVEIVPNEDYFIKRTNDANFNNYLEDSSVGHVSSVTNYRISSTDLFDDNHSHSNVHFDTTIGMGNSRISVNGSFDSARKSQNNIDDVSLSYDFDGSRFSIVHSKRDDNFRSVWSDSLWDMQDIKYFSISNANERNLKKTTSTPLYVYMPGRGTIEVYKGTYRISSSNHDSGEVSIDTKGFPLGNYEVKIIRILKDGTSLPVLLKNFNNKNFSNEFSINAGEFKYVNELTLDKETGYFFSVDKTFVSNDNYDILFGLMLSEKEVSYSSKLDFNYFNELSADLEVELVDKGKYRFLGGVSFGLIDLFKVDAQYNTSVDGGGTSEALSVNINLDSKTELYDYAGVFYNSSSIYSNSRYNYFHSSLKSHDIGVNLYKHVKIMGRSFNSTLNVGIRDTYLQKSEPYFYLSVSIPLSNSSDLIGGASINTQDGAFSANSFLIKKYEHDYIKESSLDLGYTGSGSKYVNGNVMISSPYGDGSLSVNSNSQNSNVSSSMFYSGSVVTSGFDLGLFKYSNSSSGYLVENENYDPEVNHELNLLIDGRSEIMTRRLGFVPVNEYSNGELYIHSTASKLNALEAHYNDIFYQGNVSKINLSPRSFFYVSGFYESKNMGLSKLKLVNHESQVEFNPDKVEGYFQLAVSRKNPSIKIYEDDRFLCEKSFNNDSRINLGYVFVGVINCE